MALDGMEPAAASSPRRHSLLWKVWAVSPLVALINAGAILLLLPRSFLAYLYQHPDSPVGLAVKGTMMVPMAIWGALNAYMLAVLLLQLVMRVFRIDWKHGATIAAKGTYTVLKNSGRRATEPEEQRLICKSCGFIGEPKEKKQGYGLIEALLWFFYLIPGLFYSIWRSKASYKACPSCGSKELIPVESPFGKKLAAEIRAGGA